METKNIASLAENALEAISRKSFLIGQDLIRILKTTRGIIASIYGLEASQEELSLCREYLSPITATATRYALFKISMGLKNPPEELIKATFLIECLPKCYFEDSGYLELLIRFYEALKEAPPDFFNFLL